MPKASKNPRARLHSKAAASVKAAKVEETIAESEPIVEAEQDVPMTTGGGKKARYAGVESKLPAGHQAAALKAQYLQTSIHPYSRSHMRRIKRKAKEDLSGGSLAAVQEALLDTLVTEDNDMAAEGQEKEEMDDADYDEVEHLGRRKRKRGKKAATGGAQAPVVSNAGFTMIGEGKGRTLKPKQRQQEIVKARARVGAVIANPIFKSNPFAAIREHAGNTLVKHNAAASSTS
ncbi:hypothetical protein QFC22_002136 [Naganishia vaughanmartiniae]|uniref:Uncharacterized protein n=1 Tax=Naganishia vaughanmartiniae TaxID=1424756 RepID=A0ACC2XD23_9TREE|nr:hypothetical protein QFC22_002136 [Naganishia vaughanmartiniae]